MSLSDIANKLRTDALADPGNEKSTPLTHGASCHMRAEIVPDDMGDDSGLYQKVEWHLKIERVGQLPLEASKEYVAWLRELKTFRDEKYFNVPAQVEATMVPGKRKYAAVFVWTALVESELVPPQDTPRRAPRNHTTHVTPIPQNEREMEAWAATLGPGVRVRGVDVFTGEF